MGMQGEDDGSSEIPVNTYLESREGEKPLGVYAIYDNKNNVQYIGYSRNIVLAVKVQDLQANPWHKRSCDHAAITCSLQTVLLFSDEQQ